MKGRSAYFVFAEEQRPTAREQLLRERGEGAKVSVAEVAKVIGQRWQQLDEAGRQAYKAKAKEEQVQADRAAALAAKAGHGEEQQLAEGEEHNNDEEAGPAAGMEAKESKKDSNPADGLLPISNVRRIMLLDDDVSRVSHDGVIAVAIATDLLLGLLVKHAGNQAKSQKRRTILLKDFVQAVKQERRLTQAGLRDVEAAVTSAAAAGAAARSQAKEAAEAAKEAAAAEAVAAGVEGGVEGGEGETGGGKTGAQDENQAPNKEDGEAGEAGGEKVASGKKKQGRKAGGEQQKLKQAAAGVRKIDTFFAKATS